MKKIIKNAAILSVIVTGLICIGNKIISVVSNLKDDLPESGGRFYKWKFGNIFYTKRGNGRPILLIHNLDAAGSSYEWNRIVKTLSRKKAVFTIDLIGCGRSDKPHLTYTNYLYVQLINDFIREIIREKTDVIVSGKSLSFVIMACQMESNFYNKLIAVNPPDLYELAKMPTKRNNILKLILESPILGTFIYNMVLSKNHIIDKITEEGFYKSHLVYPKLIDANYKAAHNQKGKYLLASMKSYYTNINIVPALKKINNSICLIGGSEQPFIEEIISDYKTYNPAVEETRISNTMSLPHLETPEKFISLIQIILNS